MAIIKIDQSKADNIRSIVSRRESLKAEADEIENEIRNLREKQRRLRKEAGGLRNCDIADMMKVSRTTITDIINGKTWSYGENKSPIDDWLSGRC